MPETTPPIATIINPPENEPQPNREAQLDDSLSKLFGNDTSSNSKPVEQPEKPVEKPSPEEPKAQQKPVESKQDTNKVSEPEKVEEGDFNTKPSKEGWKILKENRARDKKIILEKDQELEKLKASLAEKGQTTSKEAEALKKEIEELKSYRAMVDIQADPEFVAKFDEPISKKSESVAKLLAAWGVSAEIIQRIDYTDTGLLTTIKDTIAESKDEISAKKFFRLAEEINDLYDKRTEHLEDYKSKYKEVVEAKKKESFSKQAESEGRIQQRLSEISQMKNESGESQFPFLNEISPKDPTNAAEVEQADRHNKAVAFLKGKLEGALKSETPEEKADLAVAAVAAHWSAAQLKAALQKIKSLEAELSKISKVSSETPRSQRPRVPSSNGQDHVDIDTALDNFMRTRS